MFVVVSELSPASPSRQDPSGDTLEGIVHEIAETRNLIHGTDGDGHPWSPSVRDAAQRRLAYLRESRNQLLLGEIRRGHDPVDLAVRAHIDPADVARLLAHKWRMTPDTPVEY